jgi:transglutaminase-like putative cysteine protease
MQLRVSHRTGFTYDGKVTSSYNEARMTPKNTHTQVVRHTMVEVDPSPWMYAYQDYWGTTVTAFEIHEQHDELSVVATSVVDLDEPIPSSPRLSWGDVHAAPLADQHAENLVVGPRVAPGDELLRRARDLAADSASPDEFARAVCGLVHAEVGYVTGSTQVHTHAVEAWAKRQGVCQDIAHLVIGCLRACGVPARYVSGYLHPSTEPAIGEVATGESHAWVEWWDDEWVGFDPTNAMGASQRHVVVAYGRDYADVPPLTGIFNGGSTSSMFVSVEVTRLR